MKFTSHLDSEDDRCSTTLSFDLVFTDSFFVPVVEDVLGDVLAMWKSSKAKLFFKVALSSNWGALMSKRQLQSFGSLICLFLLKIPLI